MAIPKKPRRPTPTRDEPAGAGVLYVRDPELASAVDRWIAKLNEANPDGPQWGRATLVRAVLRRALREREAKGETP